MSAIGWCFTVNNYTYEEFDFFAEKCTDLVRYMIFGIEVGEKGTPHLQGYVEFENRKKLAGCCKFFKRAHWSKRMGTRDQARTYCMKDDEYIEVGDWSAGGQGRRTDIHDLVDAVNQGERFGELLQTLPVALARNLKFYDRLVEHVEREQTKMFRHVEVSVYHGDAGTGKTRKVHDENPDVFTVNPGDAFPFDGYNGEDAILIDDFYGQGIDYGTMLRTLDGHQQRVTVKGSHRYARWTKVFITSNMEPLSWYKGITNKAALERRLTTVLKFGTEDAGNNKQHPIGDEVANNTDDEELQAFMSLYL